MKWLHLLSRHQLTFNSLHATALSYHQRLSERHNGFITCWQLEFFNWCCPIHMLLSLTSWRFWHHLFAPSSLSMVAADAAFFVVLHQSFLSSHFLLIPMFVSWMQLLTVFVLVFIFIFCQVWSLYDILHNVTFHVSYCMYRYLFFMIDW